MRSSHAKCGDSEQVRRQYIVTCDININGRIKAESSLQYLDSDGSQTISFKEFVDAVLPGTSFYPLSPVSYTYIYYIITHHSILILGLFLGTSTSTSVFDGRSDRNGCHVGYFQYVLY
jgi:hypothetical protein